jgi:hypothetical protein
MFMCRKPEFEPASVDLRIYQWPLHKRGVLGAVSSSFASSAAFSGYPQAVYARGQSALAGASSFRAKLVCAFLPLSFCFLTRS